MLEKKLTLVELNSFLKELNQPMFITSDGYLELLSLVRQCKITKLVTEETVQVEAPIFEMLYLSSKGEVSKDKPTSGKYVSIIPINGPLFSKPNMFTRWYGLMSYPDISNMLRNAISDPNSDAILFDIQSPGGQSVGLFDLVDEIYNMRDQKPIYSIANDYAFSAAYAIATGAEKIYTTRDGMVGSVGVIMQHVDYSEYLKNEGIKVTSIYAGKRKNDFSPYFPLSKEALDFGQKMVNELYEDFTSNVARNRGIDQKEVKKTEANIFNAKEAIANGFADEIGTMEDSIAKIFESNSLNSSSSSKILLVGDNHGESKIETKEQKIIEKEVKIMDLAQLKKDHPDVYNAVRQEVSAELNQEITNLKQDNAAKEARMLQLEKNDAIRTRREQENRANQIFDKALASSEIPEDMYDIVKKMVSSSKFVKDGVLDESAYLEAVNTEIKDFESRGIKKSSVSGTGFTSRKVDAEATKINEQSKSDDAEADKLLKFAGQK
jgi:signal peptide peptidase SppA